MVISRLKYVLLIRLPSLNSKPGKGEGKQQEAVYGLLEIM
jgi:hypothetical protein